MYYYTPITGRMLWLSIPGARPPPKQVTPSGIQSNLMELPSEPAQRVLALARSRPRPSPMYSLLRLSLSPRPRTAQIVPRSLPRSAAAAARRFVAARRRRDHADSRAHD